MSDLSRITGRSRYLFLDFDGTICSVFVGLAASTVADRLCELLRAEGIRPSPVALLDDSLAVLKHSAGLGAEWTERLEAALRAAEIAAIPTAVPTPQIREVMDACRKTGRTTAVVSNHSQAAVEAYLVAHGLAEYVPVISARTEPNPALLKPSPHVIAQAIHALKATQGECTLVGNSVADIQSAGAAGVRSIGYADEPGKRERLTRAGADAIITSMTELALALANTHVLPT